jgi:hypothetical protein
MSQQFAPELIERIVQEVLRRLAERGVDVATNGTNSELVLEDRLITLATLDQRLDGVKRLVVGCRAIVTPAVKDELNDRSIELVKSR